MSFHQYNFHVSVLCMMYHFRETQFALSCIKVWVYTPLPSFEIKLAL